MMRAEMFEHPDALAKLAALTPLAEGAPTIGSGNARKEGRRTVASSSGKVSGATRIGGEFTPASDPAWLKSRLDMLEAIAARNAAENAALDKPPITVTLPDGKAVDGTAWKTSPLDVATSISKGLAQAVVVASVRYSKRLAAAVAALELDLDPEGEDGEEEPAEWELWDLQRPLEGDCELQLHKFDDPRGKEVFWHSSAHILGEALESLYGARLTHGPPTDSGFFYDSFMGGKCVPPPPRSCCESAARVLERASRAKPAALAPCLLLASRRSPHC